MPTEVRAPMPGRIVEILKKIGENVLEAEEIMIMEAMKMETPIVAPRDGVIAAVKVEPGSSVAKDQTLVVID
jgi:biotin carboxyl carrier protein